MSRRPWRVSPMTCPYMVACASLLPRGSCQTSDFPLCAPSRSALSDRRLVPGSVPLWWGWSMEPQTGALAKSTTDRRQRDTGRVMPRENVEIVRQPIAVADGSRRRLDERFTLRFPRALALLAGATWRLYLLLPPRSRLRQAIVRRYIKRGVEAVNRRDLEAAFVLYHPDVESIFRSTAGCAWL